MNLNPCRLSGVGDEEFLSLWDLFGGEILDGSNAELVEEEKVLPNECCDALSGPVRFTAFGGSSLT